ncbi:response regulator receiver protein [Clostridium sartagoforme AAU1]|uniref:Stage 0 sporulation protein A homolog n=1 Tax=Clostridium sartagoforme AAU1 TaxID=1202534 RepID=R9CEG4_9CLOT|nr:response regulator [Clostridium sartagoforme]EOR27668.1 response regulator receiver protein [Clostridium sartagoforme AAU1]
MGLYKLMIVDDEEEIRLGVIKKINWAEQGFEVVGDAENGQEALEMAEKLHPDVIMTDIKMPFMDGLELGKRITDIMPSTKIIIFSGSDDLEYAHKAIKINVVEYVLKPINSIELIEVLKRLKEKLDKEYDAKRNVEILKNHYLESIPVIREQFLVGALEGRITKEQWVEDEKKLGLDFINKYLSVSLIGIDGAISYDSEGESLQNDVGLISISIKNIVDEIMANYCEFISFPYSDKVVVLATFDEKDKIMRFIKGLNEVIKVFECTFGSTISAGIGRVYDDISKIRFSYSTAQSALSYRPILGNGKTIYIEDVEPDNSIQLQFDEQEEIKFLNAIKLSTKEEIKEVVENIFRKLEESFVPLVKYRIYIMEVLTSLLKLTQTYNIEIKEVFGENFNCYVYLNELDSIEEIRLWFIDKSIKLNELIKKERINSSKLLVEKAKDYIKNNYNDYEMSVEKLCSKLHVSPTYFSTIFKKETDMSFVNYLTSVRLEEAVKLLNTTDDKTYIIATKVGYQEANYFSYVFKKQFGISPSRYRKN